MITAQLASIPEREETLIQTILSLQPQVDYIRVALNGYDELPDRIRGMDGVILELTDNVMGDANKFLGVEMRKGYVLTCDDDLIYPPNYVEYMTNKVDQYKCVVSFLGKEYGDRPVKSFRTGYTGLYRCLDEVKEDRQVDIGGTGAMAFHTDHIKVRFDHFQMRNMADIWMGMVAKSQNVPIMVVAHPKDYVKHVSYKNRIWKQTVDDQAQTDVLNSFLL